MFEFESLAERGPKHLFLDKRLSRRYEFLMDRMEDEQNCILNQLSRCRKERKAGYDFFKNERVTEQQLKERMYEKLRCSSLAYREEHLLVISDTTSYSYGHHVGQIRDQSGLGILSDEDTLGYSAHASLTLRASDLSILGLSDVQLWHLKEGRARRNSRKQRSFENKESYKWYIGLSNSEQRLSTAGLITHIHDRGGDIFENIVRIKELERSELVVRSAQNRKIVLGDGSCCMLYSYLTKQPPRYSYSIDVRGDKEKGRSARRADLDVYCCRVQLACPLLLRSKKYQYPPFVEVDVVWVKEKASSVPNGEQPIDWKLITTHRVAEDETGIRQVIQWYANRWLIEEFFLSQRQGPTIWKMPCWKQVMA
jgi:hypothetical protein